MSVLLRVAASALCAIASLSVASAQNYPTRLVHVIAPFGPGGPSDVFSRIVAQKLSEALKQSFVVENRPGASTMIGTEAPPDGYTLLIISQTHATNESLVPAAARLHPGGADIYRRRHAGGAQIGAGEDA
jgi:tripartite-type tricarboxylate transporter receptor subunit TctC